MSGRLDVLMPNSMRSFWTSGLSHRSRMRFTHLIKCSVFCLLAGRSPSRILEHPFDESEGGELSEQGKIINFDDVDFLGRAVDELPSAVLELVLLNRRGGIVVLHGSERLMVFGLCRRLGTTESHRITQNSPQ